MKRGLLLLWLVTTAAVAQEPPPLIESSGSEDAPAASSDELPDVPPPPLTAKNRLPDLTAEVLQPGEGQFNLLFLQYTRGLLPGLQVSAHFGGYLLTLFNVTGEYQFVSRPELQASVELGAYWFALSQLAKTTILQVHLQPRATMPLTGELDLNVGANLRWLVLDIPDVNQNNLDVGAQLQLIRYDAAGAWILEGRFPLFQAQVLRLAELLGQPNVSGTLLLDDLASWGVVVSRDLAIGDTTHVRFGLGYRRHPGMFMIDSVGNLILQFDLYWR